jgi:hypothetical protein
MEKLLNRVMVGALGVGCAFSLATVAMFTGKQHSPLVDSLNAQTLRKHFLNQYS